MIVDTEDILTLSPDLLLGPTDAITGELVDFDMDDVLGLSEDFPHELPFQAGEALAFSEAPAIPAHEGKQEEESPDLVAAPEFVGEVVEFAPAVALVAQRRTEEPDIHVAPASQTVPSVKEKHVVFTLAAAKFAVPMAQVLEVRDLEFLTPVMNVPAWVLGVTNLRGDIVSVVDLQKLAGVPAAEPEMLSAPAIRNLIVVQTLNADLTTCLAVESIHGMVQAAPTEIQAIDRIYGDGLTPHTYGLIAQGEELLSVLNLESLLRSLEITQ